MVIFELRPHHLTHTHCENSLCPTQPGMLRVDARYPFTRASFGRTFLHTSLLQQTQQFRTAPKFKIPNRFHRARQVRMLCKMALLYQLIDIQKSSMLYNLPLWFIAIISVCIQRATGTAFFFLFSSPNIGIQKNLSFLESSGLILFNIAYKDLLKIQNSLSFTAK